MVQGHNMIEISSFEVNRSLMYLIQNVTGEKTRDILIYFYGMAQYVCEDAMDSSKAVRVNKNIVFTYKDSPIPFRMNIYSNHGLQQIRHSGGRLSCYVAVNFPAKLDKFNMAGLMNEALEDGLGLGESRDLPLFPKPSLRVPKCLKPKKGKKK
jgi:hypothetical protein